MKEHPGKEKKKGQSKLQGGKMNEQVPRWGSEETPILLECARRGISITVVHPGGNIVGLVHSVGENLLTLRSTTNPSEYTYLRRASVWGYLVDFSTADPSKKPDASGAAA